jgi:hypothetical protein
MSIDTRINRLFKRLKERRAPDAMWVEVKDENGEVVFVLDGERQIPEAEYLRDHFGDIRLHWPEDKPARRGAEIPKAEFGNIR